MKRLFLAFVALLSFTFIAAAADVSGKWTADIPGRNGNTNTTTFNLKAAGDKSEAPSPAVRVDPPRLPMAKLPATKSPFTVTRQPQWQRKENHYNGTVKGDTIDFTAEGGRGPQTFTAKKAQ